MKEIMVRIKGHQVSKDAGEDTMEFITEAKLYEKGEAMYLIYDESELSGIPGCKTRLKFKGDQVQMKRIRNDGTMGHEIKFEKGKRHTSFYETPFGAIEMEVLTNKLENTLSADGGGQVDIDYSISLKGLMEGRNKLNITLM